MNAQRIKPALKWPGGKSRMLKLLLPMIHSTPHVCYVEGFAGGLAVLLAKERSPREVINDVNGELVNFYLNVQQHLPEVLRVLQSRSLVSRDLFFAWGAQPGLTEVTRATTFLVRNIISFGGGMKSFAVAKTAGSGATMFRKKVEERLQRLHERLDGVVIERRSFEEIIRNQDGPDTLFFFDPPYLNLPTNNYDGWSVDQVRAFARQVKKLKGKWIVTLNDAPETREAFVGCRFQEVTTKSGCVNNRLHGAKTFVELIITP